MNRKYLDPSLQSQELRDFNFGLCGRVVGQPSAVQALVDIYQTFCAGMCQPNKPVGNLLFLGPTGTGKTHLIESAADLLFGNSKAVIKVDCAEFQHSHEIAKIIGSPPGYLGHRETHPLITQDKLAEFHKDNLKLSFLLFDEIEKASDALWKLLLGILDKAVLTLGDNRKVDLSKTIVALTSNLGGKDISSLLTGSMGFVQPGPDPTDHIDIKIERTAQEAAKKKFSPEFMNRLDKVVVFRPLHREHLEQILRLELDSVQRRLTETAQFLFYTTKRSRQYLLEQGTDFKYGARHLKRVIYKYVVRPMSSLVTTRQAIAGDQIIVDWDGKSDFFTFEKLNKRSMVAVS